MPLVEFSEADLRALRNMLRERRGGKTSQRPIARRRRNPGGGSTPAAPGDVTTRARLLKTVPPDSYVENAVRLLEWSGTRYRNQLAGENSESEDPDGFEVIDVYNPFDYTLEGTATHNPLVGGLERSVTLDNEPGSSRVLVIDWHAITALQNYKRGTLQSIQVIGNDDIGWDGGRCAER